MSTKNPAYLCSISMLISLLLAGNSSGPQRKEMEVEVVRIKYVSIPFRGGYRISLGGANCPGGVPIYDFAKFSRKLHEIERIWAPRGGGGLRPSRPPKSATAIDGSFWTNFFQCSEIWSKIIFCVRPWTDALTYIPCTIIVICLQMMFNLKIGDTNLKCALSTFKQ